MKSLSSLATLIFSFLCIYVVEKQKAIA